MKLCSFDIFDTTLIRRCGKPENVWGILSTRLFPNDLALQFKFVSWRTSAQLYCIYDSNYSLEKIYNNWHSEIWNGISCKDAIKTEKEIESELLTANIEILNTIESYRNSGYKIVFISDMYLDSHFLQNVLEREGAFKENDTIYVSNECKSRKDTGHLFDYVRQIYKPEKWKHFGDNELSDYTLPRTKGIKANLVTIDYSDSESYLIDNSSLFTPSWELSTLAGLSRTARHKFGNTPEVILASEFVAPFLIPYVYHVLDNAKKRAIKTLFFVARDGYILMKLAEMIPHDGIQLKFLFVSRKSLLPLFLYGITRDRLLFYFQYHSLIGLNTHSLLNMIEMDCESKPNVDVIKTKAEEDTFLDYLFDSERYNKWQRSIKEKAEVVEKYLIQEGLSENDIGLVDVGWYGSTRMIINTTRRKWGKVDAYSYYWGIQSPSLSSRFGDFDCYMDIINNNIWVTCLIEEYFLTCPYKSTIGYCNKGEDVFPVFENGVERIDNHYFDINLQIASYILNLMNNMAISPNTLHVWSKITMKLLTSDDFHIDYSPIVLTCGNDTFSIRKLSFTETLKFIRGAKVTTNDKVCLDYTYGYKLRIRLYSIRENYLSCKKIAKRLLWA